MDNQPTNVIPSGEGDINYITTVLTKIVEGLDALEVTPDGESLNLWRRQCAWGLGLLGALKAQIIDEIGEDIDKEVIAADKKGAEITKRLSENMMVKEINKLLAEWEPDENGRIHVTSFENTEIHEHPAADPRYNTVTMSFDSYQVDCFAEQTELHLLHMEREKYNRICDRLSNWFGRAWRVIMQSGLIELDNKIVAPVVSENRYGSKQSQKHVDDARYKIKM